MADIHLRILRIYAMAGPVKKREVQQKCAKTSDDESDNASSGSEDNENQVAQEQVRENKLFVH